MPTIPSQFKERWSPNHSARPSAALIDTVVLHATANDTLPGTVRWFLLKSSKVSAHYVIGTEGVLVQMVHLARTAWHAGRSKHPADGRAGVNQRSVGIELVNMNDGVQEYTKLQLRTLGWLLSFLRSLKSVEDPATGAQMACSVAYLVGHYEIAVPQGRKTDPKGLHIAALRREFGFQTEP
jgi:N-acetylmuramoyl-L-alanine amidase